MQAGPQADLSDGQAAMEAVCRAVQLGGVCSPHGPCLIPCLCWPRDSYGQAAVGWQDPSLNPTSQTLNLYTAA